MQNLRREVEKDRIPRAAHHLAAAEYSAWVRQMIKDSELADEIAAIETAGSPPSESRRQVVERVRARYAV